MHFLRKAVRAMFAVHKPPKSEVTISFVRSVPQGSYHTHPSSGRGTHPLAARSKSELPLICFPDLQQVLKARFMRFLRRKGLYGIIGSQSKKKP